MKSVYFFIASTSKVDSSKIYLFYKNIKNIYEFTIICYIIITWYKGGFKMLDTELQQLKDKYNSLIEEKERLIYLIK